MQELTHSELLTGGYNNVIVKDMKNSNIGEQKCLVELYRLGFCPDDWIQVSLQNDQYDFCFDKFGKCIDGEFKVFVV